MTPTIDQLLRRRAAETPDKVFLRMKNYEATFAETEKDTDDLACGLLELGVVPGDHVAVLLPNRPESVHVWFALAKIGAIAAPVNTAFRGIGLAHLLNTCRAQVLVVDETLVQPVAEVREALTHLRVAVVVGDAAAAPRLADLHVVAFDAVPVRDGVPPSGGHGPRDQALVLFTSGTTGRSKGCALSHRYIVRHAELLCEHLELRSDDVLFCPFPLFHADAAVFTVAPALVLGATAAISERFSVSGFWDEVRHTQSTVFDFMGSTLAMLHKQPERPDDADNPARLGWGVPLPGFADDFEKRFAVELTELYGLTDAGIVAYNPIGQPRRRQSCGRPVAPFDVRLLDAEGFEVPVGEVGEIAVRSEEPGLLMDGYLAMPEATLAATRDLWLHTGDLARRDPDGFLYFVGRTKDVIRRRGENISAFEVEEVIGAHPDVLEAAAFGVPSDLTEEEVMVAVAPRPGHRVDPADLVTFCAARAARHMVPRYVDVLDALPKTPTEKIEKFRLVESGVTERTWDRDNPRESQ
ncbi:MAG: AMP-binding protein [Pseudonocardiales bacterium]|nr:AMP-binding protein [Pseudonocardiales bacterium]